MLQYVQALAFFTLIAIFHGHVWRTKQMRLISSPECELMPGATSGVRKLFPLNYFSRTAEGIYSKLGTDVPYGVPTKCCYFLCECEIQDCFSNLWLAWHTRSWSSL